MSSFQLPSGFNDAVRGARKTLDEIKNKPRQAKEEPAATGAGTGDSISIGPGGLAGEIEQLKQLWQTLDEGPQKEELGQQIAALEQSLNAGGMMNGLNNNPFGNLFGGMGANPFGNMFGGMGANPFASMFDNIGGGFPAMMGGFNPMMMLMSLLLQPPPPPAGPQPPPNMSPGFPDPPPGSEPAYIPNTPSVEPEPYFQAAPDTKPFEPQMPVGYCGTEAPKNGIIGDCTNPSAKPNPYSEPAQTVKPYIAGEPAPFVAGLSVAPEYDSDKDITPFIAGRPAAPENDATKAEISYVEEKKEVEPYIAGMPAAPEIDDKAALKSRLDSNS